MLWKDMISLLDSGTITVLHQNQNPDFWFVEHLDQYDQTLSSDTLYFATLSSLREDLTSEQPPRSGRLSVILLCDCEVLPSLSTFFDNIACLYTAEAFWEAFQLLNAALRQSVRFNNRLQEFMELIAMEDNLYKLSQWLSDFFGHPVSIVDNDFTCLAHSDIDGFAQIGSAELMQDIENMYVSPNHIQKLRQAQGLNLLRESSTEPALILPPGEGFRHYHTPIPIGNTIAGAFSVFLRLDEDLDPLTILYLKKIARLISIVLQRTDFYSANKANFYTTFFSTMLDGTADRSKLWETRLAAYGHVLRSSLHIIAAQLPDAVRRRSEVQSLASTLHRIVPGSIYYIQDDIIFLLCSSEPGQFSPAYLISRGDNFFVRNNMKIGVSSEFHSIYDMAAYCQEARAAIDLGLRFDPDGHFFLYDDLRIHDMVGHLARGTEIMSFCYPPFMELIKHDRENGTQLVLTLCLYLSDVKNPAVVCKKLNIHKNTLYFRLDKIRSIMKTDFTKFPILAQIFVTLVILHYTKELDRGSINPSILNSVSDLFAEDR